MVLTGLVVSVSTTAVALAIAVRTRALESRDDHGPRHDEPRT
jgi:multisubunit Na+/H+ antiporter MnhC subunit